jgi:hypothetical protein
MIARPGTEPPLPDPFVALPLRWLNWWRRVLSVGLASASRAASAAVHPPRAALSRHSSPERQKPVATDSHPALAWVGGLAVLVGAAVGVALSAPGVDRRVAALAGLASIMWAVIRWIAIRIAARRTLAENPAALRDAVALGLLVYAFAVTPELRFAAWLISAVVTGGALIGRGRDRGEVVRSVGIAWGVQALVVAGGWLARSALIALLTARG